MALMLLFEFVDAEALLCWLRVPLLVVVFGE